MKTRSSIWPSFWRFSFWSSALLRTYAIRCPPTFASNPRQEYASEATQDRTRGMECLGYLQPDNALMVAGLTRPGHSNSDLADILTVLRSGG